MEITKKESLEIGQSITEYFNDVNRIMENRIADMATAEDNCGSWREHES